MLSRVFGFTRRPFNSLSEQEILALAISSEEDDGRIYRAYADGLRAGFPQSAKVFDDMADEEDRHRSALIGLHRARFGETIPLIRREHVRGYYERKPDWLVRPLGIDKVRAAAEDMEAQAHRFYVEAGKRTKDASTRQLLGDLAVAEQGHRRSPASWSTPTHPRPCNTTSARPNGASASSPISSRDLRD